MAGTTPLARQHHRRSRVCDCVVHVLRITYLPTYLPIHLPPLVGAPTTGVFYLVDIDIPTWVDQGGGAT